MPPLPCVCGSGSASSAPAQPALGVRIPATGRQCCHQRQSQQSAQPPLSCLCHCISSRASTDLFILHIVRRWKARRRLAFPGADPSRHHIGRMTHPSPQMEVRIARDRWAICIRFAASSEGWRKVSAFDSEGRFNRKGDSRRPDQRPCDAGDGQCPTGTGCHGGYSKWHASSRSQRNTRRLSCSRFWRAAQLPAGRDDADPGRSGG